MPNQTFWRNSGNSRRFGSEGVALKSRTATHDLSSLSVFFQAIQGSSVCCARGRAHSGAFALDILSRSAAKMTRPKSLLLL
jgi:hypothetical protein